MEYDAPTVCDICGSEWQEQIVYNRFVNPNNSTAYIQETIKVIFICGQIATLGKDGWTASGCCATNIVTALRAELAELRKENEELERALDKRIFSCTT